MSRTLLAAALSVVAYAASAEPPCEANGPKEIYRSKVSEDFFRLGWGGEIDPSTGVKTVYYWLAKLRTDNKMVATAYSFDCGTLVSSKEYSAVVDDISEICSHRVALAPGALPFGQTINTPRGTAGAFSCYLPNFGM